MTELGSNSLEFVELSVSESPFSQIATQSQAGKQSGHWRRYLAKLSLARHFRTWQLQRRLKQQLQIAIRFLNDRQVTSVAVAGDRNSGFEPALLRAARIKGIPCLIPPSAFSATMEGLFIWRRQQSGHIVTRNVCFQRRFPSQWRFDTVSGEKLSFFGEPATRAYAALRMLPPNPWVLGGGYSDWILVDSSDVKQRYLELGVPENKVVATGHPDFDLLAVAMQNKERGRQCLVDKYHLDPTRKIVVITLPNWAEVGLKEWDWHWAENQLLCQSAVSQSCNVLLSLHPTQQRQHYLFLEQIYRPLRIIDEKLATVLPVADIFLTGLASSTIPWAVLSAVPTIIADHYPEKDRIHQGLPGVFYIEHPDLLVPALSGLIEDQERFQAVRDQQRQQSERYGRLDGMAMRRIVDALLTYPPQHINPCT